ncbi:MAG: hypothetical protein O6940_12030 [Ignavibacteria bacterium]|nr:hypothetical protein [Ignavibacteria bacterium]
MDNIFEILIYLFIIISFVSSFFRKKKKELIKREQMMTQISDQARINEEVDVQASPSVQTQEQKHDILKEFEGFFNVGKREEESQIQPLRETLEETDESKKEFIRIPEDSFHTQTESEHTLIDPWDEKKVEIDKSIKSISPEIEKKASDFKEYLEIPETSGAKISHKIRDRMKQPATLKEYVVISEIMGKPKALKR